MNFRTEQEIKIYRKYSTEGKKGLNLLCNFLQSKSFRNKTTGNKGSEQTLTNSDLIRKKELEEVLEKSTVQNSFRAFIINCLLDTSPESIIINCELINRILDLIADEKSTGSNPERLGDQLFTHFFFDCPVSQKLHGNYEITHSNLLDFCLYQTLNVILFKRKFLDVRTTERSGHWTSATTRPS